MEKVGSTYYHRRIVPSELRPYFLTTTGKPRVEFKTSLKTKDRATADKRLEVEDAVARRKEEERKRQWAQAAVASVGDNPGLEKSANLFDMLQPYAQGFNAFLIPLNGNWTSPPTSAKCLPLLATMD